MILMVLIIFLCLLNVIIFLNLNCIYSIDDSKKIFKKNNFCMIIYFNLVIEQLFTFNFFTTKLN